MSVVSLLELQVVLHQVKSFMLPVAKIMLSVILYRPTKFHENPAIGGGLTTSY